MKSPFKIIEKNRETIVSWNSPKKHTFVSTNELIKRGNSLSTLLKDIGCSKGDVVPCIMEKSYDFLVTLIGLNNLGCICVPLSPDISIKKAKSIIGYIDVKLVITDENASHLIKSNLLNNSDISLGWMGERNDLPENFYPEFVKENIEENISSEMLFEVDEGALALIFFEEYDFNFDLVYTITNKELEESLIKMSELINTEGVGISSSFLPNTGVQFLVDLLIISSSSAEVHMNDSRLLKNRSRAVRSIKDNRIRGLFCCTNDFENFIAGFGFDLPVFENISSVTLWGRNPSQRNKLSISKSFPNAKILKAYSHHEEGGKRKRDRSLVNNQQTNDWLTSLPKTRLRLFVNEVLVRKVTSTNTLPKMRFLELGSIMSSGFNESSFKNRKMGALI